MLQSILSIALVAQGIAAFPFVLDSAGVDSTLLRRQQSGGNNAGGPATCPFNPNHVPAVGISDAYPYNGAKKGRPGKGVGGYKVPADGDTAHYFVAPTSKDIRGPCPGLNAAANHGFLAHDGITTFSELVDAQQNLYNVGYDLAVVLALLGLTLGDGDIVTERLSIGCDATTRTSFAPLLTGSQPGLAGHNKFEADASLTRNDFFTHGGDNFNMNTTLFDMMVKSTGGNFGRDQMAQYRLERYQQSRQDNPNFYFGPLALLLYGASSFLYELMPSGTRGYAPDVETISSFFGVQQAADGSWKFGNNEKIPDNWTNRVKPYSLLDVGSEILVQYLKKPVLFGGATGNGGFDLLNFGNGIQNGSLIALPDVPTVTCLLYQLLTERLPASLNGVITPTVEVLSLVLSKVAGPFANLGCPQPLT